MAGGENAEGHLLASLKLFECPPSAETGGLMKGLVLGRKRRRPPAFSFSCLASITPIVIGIDSAAPDI